MCKLFYHTTVISITNIRFTPTSSKKIWIPDNPDHFPPSISWSWLSWHHLLSWSPWPGTGDKCHVVSGDNCKRNVFKHESRSALHLVRNLWQNNRYEIQLYVHPIGCVCTCEKPMLRPPINLSINCQHTCMQPLKSFDGQLIYLSSTRNKIGAWALQSINIQTHRPAKKPIGDKLPDNWNT
jgi:hypothetical protein